MLAYLLAHRDRVVPKHELLEHLWPDQFVGDAVLKACITALRKALGEQGRTPRFVRTLHGQGYRFVAAVEAREHLPVDAAPPALARRSSLAPRGRRGQWGGEHGSGQQQLSPVGIESLEGEHKQVTVLCGALAEALTLAARLGPEAMYPMRVVLALVQDTVQRYDGTLLQVSGEGFLALFGAPVAHEDHARRAVLAAFELRQRLHAPDALRGQPHDVAVRLGLHTGTVVVGPGTRPTAALHCGWRHAPCSDSAPAAGRARYHPRQRCHLQTGTGRGAGRGMEALTFDTPLPRWTCMRSAGSGGGGRASHGATHGP